MNESAGFPLTASIPWMLLAALLAYLAFDVVFGRIMKLGKKGWKRMDYAWLSLASVGLIGTVSSVRQQMAPVLGELQRSAVLDRYEGVRSKAQFLSEGSVCRQFSGRPPQNSALTLARIQAEYDAACAYGKTVRSLLPDTVPHNLASILTTGRPHVSEPMLRENFADLDRRAVSLDSAVRIEGVIKAAGEQNPTEFGLAVVSPFFLALALGLRAAKVTGELRLET